MPCIVFNGLRMRQRGKSQASQSLQGNGVGSGMRENPHTLTPLEFRMLRLLLSRPGRVFSREQLLDAAHADLREVSDRTIDTHVKNLRKKIQQVDADADCLVSVYGVGHRFEPPV